MLTLPVSNVYIQKILLVLTLSNEGNEHCLVKMESCSYLLLVSLEFIFGGKPSTKKCKVRNNFTKVRFLISAFTTENPHNFHIFGLLQNS